jgi:hypothetical protein
VPAQAEQPQLERNLQLVQLRTVSQLLLVRVLPLASQPVTPMVHST